MTFNNSRISFLLLYTEITVIPELFKTVYVFFVNLCYADFVVVAELSVELTACYGRRYFYTLCT